MLLYHHVRVLCSIVRLFFILKYVFMYVLCVWLVHKCAKLESDGRWRAKWSAFCIGFYETQITYENLPEIQEIRHYSNEGKYVLLPRYQLPSTIIKIIAHIYDINAIEILIDLLHIYSMFTGTQLQRSKCIHFDNIHTYISGWKGNYPFDWTLRIYMCTYMCVCVFRYHIKD